MPAKGVTKIDPNFHTSIKRITDKSIDGYAGPGIENEYSRTDPENCDGAVIILRENAGEWHLYNALTRARIKQVSITGGGEEPEPRWDAVDPNIFYYLYGTELRSYNITNDASTLIHNFNYPSATFISTKTEGDASLDRRYWCFIIEDAAYNVLKVICYDKTTDTILGTYERASLPTGIGINWVSMSMSGSHCIIGYQDDGAGDTPPTETFTRSLTHVATLPAGTFGHMDLAIDKSGNDVMVYQKTSDSDQIAMADLATGAETYLVEIPFGINGDIGLHFSGNCSQTPGWVLVSTYGSENPPTGETHSWMDEQLFMVELKSSPRIWRLTHTQAYTSLNYIADKNYFAECFAAINTSGTKIYFGSNWRNYTTDFSESYQIDLPGSWNTLIP